MSYLARLLAIFLVCVGRLSTNRLTLALEVLYIVWDKQLLPDLIKRAEANHFQWRALAQVFSSKAFYLSPSHPPSLEIIFAWSKASRWIQATMIYEAEELLAQKPQIQHWMDQNAEMTKIIKGIQAYLSPTASFVGVSENQAYWADIPRFTSFAKDGYVTVGDQKTEEKIFTFSNGDLTYDPPMYRGKAWNPMSIAQRAECLSEMRDVLQAFQPAG